MKLFLGEYNPAITNGYRIALPKKIREVFGDSNICVLTRGFDSCILGYKKDTWIKANEELYSSNVSSKKTRMLKRYVYGSASYTKLDSQGRTVIPKNLVDYAKLSLDSDITVIGAGDHFEIWDTKIWKEYSASFDLYEGEQ